MTLTRRLTLGLALVLLLGGVCIGASPDAVLARCYPTGELAAPSRYYVRHWATGLAAMGGLLGLLGWRGDRNTLRLGLVIIGLAYLAMTANFWLSKTRGWIPYARQCVVEELSIEIGVAVLLGFLALRELLAIARGESEHG